MKTARFAGIVAVVLMMAGGMLALVGCRGIPAGTTKEITIGATTLQATGAGIVKADAQKTTFRIKCAVCGFEPDPITIDTPTAGKPYVLNWVCPKCGHKQKIVIQLAVK